MTDFSNPSNTQDAEGAMSAMLIELLNALLDRPEECSVDTVSLGETTMFVVEIEAEDLEHLTRDNARTLRSLKLLVGAVGMKALRRFSITFRENSGSSPSTPAMRSEITKT